MSKYSKAALAVSFFFIATASHAEIGNDWFHLSGFGTAAAVKNTSDNTYYRTNSFQPSGANNGWDGGPLNRLGAQASFTPLPWLEGTVQMISQRRYDDSYDPSVEWAFVKFKPAKDVAIRVGRMALPAFMVSDSRNVGYVNTMTTPPIDVYTQVPATKYDGADLTWRANAGPVDVTLNPYTGRRREVAADGVVLNLDKILGLNVTAEWESWTLHAGYMSAELYSRNESALSLWSCMRGQLNSQCSTLASLYPVAAQIATDLDLQHKAATFSGIGVQYDNGKIIAASEYTRRKVDGELPDTSAWYLMGGYRIGKFTPYASFSRLKNDQSLTDSRLSSLPAAWASAVNSVLVGLANDQKTSTIGMRWDFYKNTALKLQYDRIHITNNLGYAYKEAPGSQGPSPLMHVYSAVIDFVF